MLRRSSGTAVAVLALVLAGAAACAVGGSSKANGGNGDGPLSGDETGDPPLPPPRNPDYTDPDAAALNIGNRGKDGGAVTPPQDGGSRDPGDASDVPPVDANLPDTNTPPPPVDASPPPPQDAGGTTTPPNACPTPLGAGDLAIVELMIASQSGSGDKGEWVEIQSTRPCAVNLKGLHIASPRGTGSDTADVTGDLWLAPNGIIVVANSPDAATNHSLPTPLILWSGGPADVLKNDGDTITLSVGATTVDTLTYPAFTLYPGRSISFPADCTWADRSSWARWSYSFYYWTGTFQGTPNTDNTDVTCY